MVESSLDKLVKALIICSPMVNDILLDKALSERSLALVSCMFVRNTPVGGDDE
jgi:hypothetical protein